MVDVIDDGTLNTELRDAFMELVDSKIGSNGMTMAQDCSAHDSITRGFEIMFINGTSRLVLIMDRVAD